MKLIGENKIHSDLTLIEKSIMEKSFATKIKDVPVKDLKIQLMALIENARFKAGQNNADEKDLAYLNAELLKDIEKNYSFLTIQEVGFAFQNLLENKYGEFFGINWRSLYSAIQKFIDERGQAHIKNRKLIEREEAIAEKAKKISIEQRQKENYEGLIKYISENKKLPLAWDFVGCYFHLERIGEINYSIEEKKKYVEMFKQELQEKYSIEKSMLKSSLASETLSQMNNESNFKNHCRSEMVKIFLEYKFNQLKTNKNEQIKSSKSRFKRNHF